MHLVELWLFLILFKLSFNAATHIDNLVYYYLTYEEWSTNDSIVFI